MLALWKIKQLLTQKISPVRILFTSASEAGSWQIRGVQMASMRRNWEARGGAETIPSGVQVLCVVKWPDLALMQQARKRGIKILFDVVDSWRQPEDDRAVADLDGARALFSRRWRELPIDGFIFPNARMRDHFADWVGPSICLYHHYNPLLRPVTLRQEAKVIGYQGDTRFLGEWRGILEELADELRMRVDWQVRSLAGVDIGFAARGAEYGGFLAANYKSNVKLANFIGAGLPCVLQAGSAAYEETAPSGVPFFRDKAELRQALTALLPLAKRQELQGRLLAKRATFSIEPIAAQLEKFAAGLCH